MFLINRGDLEERLDAGFYQALQNSDYIKLKQSKYPVFRLGELSTFITKGETPLWRGDDYITEGIPFLRGKNIKHGEIEFKDIVYISPDVHKRMLRSQLNEDFFLLTMAGTLGDVAYFKSDYPESNINQDIAKIKLTDAISYKYAVSFFCTQLALSQIKTLSNGGTRNHLNFSQIRKFKVIVPPKNVQQQIVKYQEEINQIKKQKEAEAAALLASIDGYLLQELGIDLSRLGWCNQPNNQRDDINVGLQKAATQPTKVFYTSANKLSGGRFDPYFHQTEFENLDKALENAKFDIHTLGFLTLDLKNGAEFRTYSEQGYRYLRVTDLSKDGISDKNMRFVDIPDIPERLKLNHDCILISRSGSLGLVNIVTDEIIDSVLSSHIFKIQLNINRVLPSYLESYLRSTLGQKQFFRNNNGGVIPEINQFALKSIKIVLPPPEKQTQIANHISELRAKAKQLQQDAETELQQAKQQVERLILGA